MKRRDHHPAKGFDISSIAATRRQWDVDVVALPGPLAGLAESARIGREEIVLMERNRECRWIGIEGRLGAIAMVHVPVDRGDTAQSVHFAGMQYGDHRIGEQAETHAETRHRVMAWRAYQRIGILDLAADDRIEGG